ncbi:spore germination protein [Paenibacillus sp. HN-1]|uniref:spore germination protein n=1 Tax=Paenibacillus TaxID=44249 RepID=UPI001CA8038C|nr:spore germination protein [Paenibacillus sp. CGMCC 1.18879]MBY9087697.1 spore germination protein [Paenibacillus sinensis]
MGDGNPGEGEAEDAQGDVNEPSGKSSKAEADSGKDKKKPKDKKESRLQEKRDKELSNSLEESIRYWNGDDRVPESLDKTRSVLTEVIGLDTSFDIVFREMSFAGTKAGLLFVSGFAKDFVMDEILKRLTYLTPSDMLTDAFAAFLNDYIPHIQVEKTDRFSEAVSKTMMGMSTLFVDGERHVIVMDTRAYPSRSPDEPTIERVVRGARDGFTETLLSNVALVRRRLRDPGLTFKLHQVGRRTNTDVAIAYIDDIVDKSQVEAVSEKIAAINIDGIPLADKQLEEAIVGKNWNPYPMVRYSERPDVVASHLMEGRVVVFVDTSPSVMVIPTTFFDLCQHAEENRQTPLVGSYLRWVRFIGILCSIFLLPLWMLFVMHPELKPASLEFIGPQKMAKIPLLAQFMMIELGVDLLRMAAVHTPTPLGSAMGLIAAIMIGDIAVKTGLFVNEVILYMALATIGMFATPSYELGLANRIVRLLLLLATGLFHVPGFVIGSTLLIVLLTLNRSYNSSYLWPFIPFNAKALGSILFRREVMASETRPSFNKTRDNTRIGPAKGQNNKS